MDKTSLSQPTANDLLQIYHQNIQLLKWKTNEPINFLQPDLPNILCLTEYNLNHYKIHFIHTDNYNLGVKYCRHYFMKGGVCTLFMTSYILKIIINFLMTRI
jgi:hypothetical protein